MSVSSVFVNNGLEFYAWVYIQISNISGHRELTDTRNKSDLSLYSKLKWQIQSKENATVFFKTTWKGRYSL